MGNQKPFRSYTERALSDAQYDALLRACDRYEDVALVYLGARFGLRRYDICHVNVADIDTTNNTITFYEQKKQRIRTLPIPGDLQSWFKQYITNLPKTQKTVFSYVNDKTCYNRLQGIAGRAGIDLPFPVHSLRGTCYKMLRKRYNFTLEAAAAWLGDTVAVASAHYGLVTSGELADLVRTVENIL